MHSILDYFALVAFTTAGVSAFISVQIEDERTKKILRAIAVVLFVSSVITAVQKASELLAEVSKLEATLAEQKHLVEEARAKAAEADLRIAVAEKDARDAKVKADSAEQREKLKLAADVQFAKQAADISEQAHKDELAKINREREERERVASDEAAAIAGNGGRPARRRASLMASDICRAKSLPGSAACTARCQKPVAAG